MQKREQLLSEHRINLNDSVERYLMRGNALFFKGYTLQSEEGKDEGSDVVLIADRKKEAPIWILLHALS